MKSKWSASMHHISPFIALAVILSTATTDAVYVLFTSAVSAHRRIPAANWSSLWYVLSAFAVISYTNNAVYVVFAALGSWLGAFCAVSYLRQRDPAATRSPAATLKPL